MEKEKDIKISVIMGVYNQWNKKALYEAVLSILRQTFSELELIIYNDGSDPEAGSYIQELEPLDDRIVLIGREENHGLAFSLNACIAKARGTYIARMDADDISLPKRLKVQYDFLETHPEYGWCGLNALLFDEKGIWGSREMVCEPKTKDYLPFSPYIHPTVMMRSSIFRENGGYRVSPETLRCEDYEIFMRLHQAGYRGYNIQQSLFLYREDKASFQRRKFCYRWNESKVRYRNFKKMHLLFPAGLIYVLRPIIGGLIPAGLIGFMKRQQAEKREYEGRKTEPVAAALSEDLTEKSSA